MTTPSGSTTAQLSGAVAYFTDVVKANKETFFGNPSTFATALNLATSLFHFHEWLFDEFKPQLEAEFGTTFSGKGAFWRAIETRDARFGYIRDVTNASKHVNIGGPGFPPPSTGMTHIANTHIVSTGFGVGGYGLGRYGGGANVVFDDSGNQISFDDCALALFNFWEALLKKVAPPPVT